MSALLALTAASMSAELHANLGTVARTKKLDDIGAKNGLACVDNGMAYTGGCTGITIDRDAAGQSQSSIAALKTAAKTAAHSVPTSLLAAGRQGHRYHAGARC